MSATNKKHDETGKQDCLHCQLWPVIHRYCREHPDGCVQDMIDGVVDVIGDYLTRSDVWPQHERLWQQTKKRIKNRMRDSRKHWEKLHG